MIKKRTARIIIHLFPGQTHQAIHAQAHTANPTQDSDINAIISAADSALYRAKDNGRN